jgi:UDP-2-acetamido-2-deoxy-ribo-hexuluronate aminotransferase
VVQKSDRTSVFAQYTVFVNNREVVQKALLESGIVTAVHYPIPLNEQPAYRFLCCSDCTPMSKEIAQKVMSLPMSPDLSENAQDQIVNALLGSLKV